VGAIGLQISRGVAMHGVALNVNVDLSWFDNIVPCGHEIKRVTSMSKLLKQNDLSLQKVQTGLAHQLSTRFGHDKVMPVSPEQLIDQVDGLLCGTGQDVDSFRNGLLHRDLQSC
jgi:lipoate-protein ligase B